MFSLSFQNMSNAVQDADLQAFIQDFQSQISNDFHASHGARPRNVAVASIAGRLSRTGSTPHGAWDA